LPVGPTGFEGPALKALELAAKPVAAKVQLAKQRKTDDVERAIDYLEAAREAIKGLEMEAQAILSQASVSNLGDQRDVLALRARLEVMLQEDRIRPLLIEALEGANQAATQLRARANKRLQLKRSDKAAIVNDADALVEDLTEYLDALSPELGQFASELPELATITGPRAHELGWLRHITEQVLEKEINADAARDQVDSIVLTARSGAGADFWLALIRRTETITNQIRSRFA
jgi:hypothetical protein